MPNNSFQKLYVDELKDLYSAESQLLKALPKMASAASAPELQQGFEKHLKQTEGHVQRLEHILEALGESPKGKKCVGMEGLIKEGSEAMEEGFEGAVLDSALIGAARRVEHYEMAAYDTVSALAKVLGETEHASLLEETLAEETQTDEKLTELAGKINSHANEGRPKKDQRESKQDTKTSKRVA
ncbi:MAG: ferritin-like domain-containing protein [Candidatus Sulfotelmatobacter sp.]|jgi:ferritin-like metal-binding protein YciE